MNSERDFDMQKIYVLFWFDVEDYITPQSDDALKKIVTIFDAQGAKATFKFVGEKIRALEARGRSDVIEKVAAHDIGYHTDNHSQHPTVSEYLEGLGWDEGVAEFERRERPGMDDLERIFGKRISTYGQPGGAWAPQVYPVLKKWGIPTYVDEAGHVGLNDQPFWYCGILNVFNMQSTCTRVSIGPDENALASAKSKFNRILDHPGSNGCGSVSIYYHPCEFVTTQFWDGVNFSKGKNTPRSEWRIPNLKAEEDIERGYRVFSEYLAYIDSRPEVEIITAGQAAEIYRDRSVGRKFALDEMLEICDKMQDDIGYQIIGDVALSPAEIFSLVVAALSHYSKTGALPDGVVSAGPIGPVNRFTKVSSTTSMQAKRFLEICVDTWNSIQEEGRLPDYVVSGGARISLADFLVTASAFLKKLVSSPEVPEKVRIRKGNFTLEKYVTEDGVWGWSIFPEGFRAPEIMELAKLQTWTLKPALL